MKIEIINIGTELLLGEIVNTNATALQKMCKDLGFEVYHQSVVGDNPQRIKECFEIAFHRGADCVITTGGLGPTEDDLTKEISADYLGLEMVYNEEEANRIYEKCAFVMHSPSIASSNYKQAYFPKDCFIINNRIGTANGCVMKKDDKMIVNLPGPPKEMNWCIDHVLKDYFKPYAREKLYTCDIDAVGLGESNMAVMLDDIVQAQTEVSIAIYAQEDYNRVRLGVKAMSQAEADQKMEPIKQQIEDRFGNHVANYEMMKKKVLEALPPFTVYYEDDFHLDENIFKGSNYLCTVDEPQDNSIIVKRKRERLGDQVTICYKDKEEIMYLLYDASLSMKKIEGKLFASMYKWLFLE